MSKTSDAIEILRRRREANPKLQKIYEEEELKYQIALAIRELREHFGLTQGELAKKMGTSQSAIARLEDTDYEGYSLPTLQRLAQIFQCRLIIRFDFSHFKPALFSRGNQKVMRRRFPKH